MFSLKEIDKKDKGSKDSTDLVFEFEWLSITLGMLYAIRASSLPVFESSYIRNFASMIVTSGDDDRIEILAIIRLESIAND